MPLSLTRSMIHQLCEIFTEGDRESQGRDRIKVHCTDPLFSGISSYLQRRTFSLTRLYFRNLPTNFIASIDPGNNQKALTKIRQMDTSSNTLVEKTSSLVKRVLKALLHRERAPPGWHLEDGLSEGLLRSKTESFHEESDDLHDSDDLDSYDLVRAKSLI